MMRALFKFVDGFIQEPQKFDQLRDAWVRCNTMILSWINTISRKQNKESTSNFTHEDYDHLIDMLKKAKLQSPEHNINQLVHQTIAESVSSSNSQQNQPGNPLEHTNWILDTGATNHVCNSLYHPIDPVHVKLPNGITSTAQFSRAIIFSEKFFLNDVLYIPNFHLNIISVQRIVASLDYELIFNKNSCIIQDLTSKKMIEVVENIVLSLHYNQSHHDHHLFTKHHGTRFTMILIYVDDLIIAGTDSDEINHIKQSLDVKFKIKDLGLLRYFLGLEMSRSAGLFHLLPIASSHQLADIFTKPLDPSPFQYLLSKLGLINIYSPACRGVLDHNSTISKIS
uniref:Uncharacterized protein n=1 Tax=Cajanus cajan TaxID=3821 RepID=A0A151SD86_CAJCA|nr:hypothetical protein KK1_025330 [Cajanus cajan]